MSTYTQILYHIVYATRDHRGCLDLDYHDSLCAYIAGILKHKQCMPYKLGGYTDHLHILTSLHPSVCLADLVKDIKLATSQWIKTASHFPDFVGWQEGYGAFTCSWSVKGEVEDYISNQRQHHNIHSFREEYTAFLKRAGIEYNEAYLG
jgi:putative transposase